MSKLPAANPALFPWKPRPLTDAERNDPANPKPYVPYAGNPQNDPGHNAVVTIDGSFIPKFVKVFEHSFGVEIRPYSTGKGSPPQSVVTGKPDNVKRFLMNHYNGDATIIRAKHPHIAL
jgi:hypothetical protein